MKNLTDWFDRVYVINCAHRPDRLEETKKHLEETGMANNDKVHYYPAIIGDWVTHPADWVPVEVRGVACVRISESLKMSSKTGMTVI